MTPELSEVEIVAAVFSSIFAIAMALMVVFETIETSTVRAAMAMTD